MKYIKLSVPYAPFVKGWADQHEFCIRVDEYNNDLEISVVIDHCAFCLSWCLTKDGWEKYGGFVTYNKRRIVNFFHKHCSYSAICNVLYKWLEEQQ